MPAVALAASTSNALNSTSRRVKGRAGDLTATTRQAERASGTVEPARRGGFSAEARLPIAPTRSDAPPATHGRSLGLAYRGFRALPGDTERGLADQTSPRRRFSGDVDPVVGGTITATSSGLPQPRLDPANHWPSITSVGAGRAGFGSHRLCRLHRAEVIGAQGTLGEAESPSRRRSPSSERRPKRSATPPASSATSISPPAISRAEAAYQRSTTVGWAPSRASPPPGQAGRDRRGDLRPRAEPQGAKLAGAQRRGALRDAREVAVSPTPRAPRNRRRASRRNRIAGRCPRCERSSPRREPRFSFLDGRPSRRSGFGGDRSLMESRVLNAAGPARSPASSSRRASSAPATNGARPRPLRAGPDRAGCRRMRAPRRARRRPMIRGEHPRPVHQEARCRARIVVGRSRRDLAGSVAVLTGAGKISRAEGSNPDRIANAALSAELRPHGPANRSVMPVRNRLLPAERMDGRQLTVRALGAVRWRRPSPRVGRLCGAPRLHEPSVTGAGAAPCRDRTPDVFAAQSDLDRHRHLHLS